jgi:DNA primase
MLSENKFMKVREYIQGTDQLTFSKKHLVICSSLKDLMALMKMNYKEIEAVAPDSENTLIKPHVMNAYQIKYQSIATLFDNDVAGIEAMQKYKDTYQIPGIRLELSKDLSDSVKDHGLNKVREQLTPLLTKALKP